MPNRKSKGPSNAAILLTAVVALGVVGGLALYVKNSPASAIPAEELKPDRRPKVEGSQAAPGPDQRTALVFSPRFEGENLSFDRSERPVPAGEDPMVFAVNEYLKLSNIADSDVRLLSVQVRDGLATLNFTEGFRQTQGSMDEGTLVQGIQRTMGQFRGVERMLFEAEGQPVDTLGHLELSDPVPVIR